MTYPLPTLDPEAVPGSTSVSDKAIVGYVNEDRAAINDLDERLRVLELLVGPPTTPTYVLDITTEQEAAIAALAVGALIELRGPSNVTGVVKQ